MLRVVLTNTTDVYGMKKNSEVYDFGDQKNDNK